MPLVSIDIRPRQADLVIGSTFPSPSSNSNDSSQSDQSQTDTNVARKSSKSHARKREEGHIPRPRNAFIIFRTDFVTNGRIPSTIEVHSQNLSRIAGNVWKSMSPEEKKPWFARAEEEKAKHLEKHPEYQYHPTDPYMLRNRRKVRKGRGELEMRKESKWCDEVAKVLKDGAEGEQLEKELKKRTPTAATTSRPRGPMAVDDFPSIEPIVDIGYASTETIPCIPSTFDDPVRQFDATASAAALLNNEPLSSTLSMLMSSRESSPPTLSASASSTSSSPSTNSHMLSLPPISTTPLILPSKISIPRSSARQLPPPPPPPFPGALHVPDKPRSSYRGPPPAHQSTYTYENVLPSKIRSYGAPPLHSSSFRNPNPNPIPPSPFSSSSSSSGGSRSSSHPHWPSSSSVAMQYRPSDYGSNATTNRGDAWALRSPGRGPVSTSMLMSSRPASSNFAAATSRSRRLIRGTRYDSDEDEDEYEYGYSSDREHDYDYESD